MTEVLDIQTLSSYCANCFKSFAPQNDDGSSKHISPISNARVSAFKVIDKGRTIEKQVVDGLGELFGFRWLNLDHYEQDFPLVLCYDCTLTFTQLYQFYTNFKSKRDFRSVLTVISAVLDELWKKYEKSSMYDEIVVRCLEASTVNPKKPNKSKRKKLAGPKSRKKGRQGADTKEESYSSSCDDDEDIPVDASPKVRDRADQQGAMEKPQSVGRFRVNNSGHPPPTMEPRALEKPEVLLSQNKQKELIPDQQKVTELPSTVTKEVSPPPSEQMKAVESRVQRISVAKKSTSQRNTIQKLLQNQKNSMERSQPNPPDSTEDVRDVPTSPRASVGQCLSPSPASSGASKIENSKSQARNPTEDHTGILSSPRASVGQRISPRPSISGASKIENSKVETRNPAVVGRALVSALPVHRQQRPPGKMRSIHILTTQSLAKQPKPDSGSTVKPGGSETGKPTCPLCSKEFASEFSLSCHRNYCRRPNEILCNEQVPCEFCGLKFGSQQALNSHLNSCRPRAPSTQRKNKCMIRGCRKEFADDEEEEWGRHCREHLLKQSLQNINKGTNASQHPPADPVTSKDIGKTYAVKRSNESGTRANESIDEDMIILTPEVTFKEEEEDDTVMDTSSCSQEDFILGLN